MKIWTNDRSNNVHTQRTPLQHRATLHRTTRITLASLLFGRYACLLCFLRPLISRKGLLATSWRRSFGLLLSRCGAAGSGCMTLGPIGAFIFCDRLTIDGMLLRAMVGPTVGKLMTRYTRCTCALHTFAPLRPQNFSQKSSTISRMKNEFFNSFHCSRQILHFSTMF